MSDIYSKLVADLPVLLQTGVVTKAQADRLLAHYRAESEESHGSKLVPILSIIWSVFVGVGFILYFAANWDQFSDYAKLWILVTAVLASYAAAFVLLFVRDYQKTGHAMALLWSLLYGASIFLTGQTFNLWGTFPDALLLWLLGVLPLAYVSRLASFPVLLSVLFSVWLISDWSETGTYFRHSDAALLFPLAVWSLLSGISVWHEGSYRFFKTAYARLGIFAIFSWTFLFTFQDILQDIGGWSKGFLSFILFTALGLVSYATYLFKNKTAEKSELLPLLHVGVLVAVWLAASNFADRAAYSWGIFSLPLFDASVLVFANVYFVLFCVAAMYFGIAKKDSFTVNLSLAFITVFVFAKYFDWFFEMMDRAVFFIVWGTLFVLVGWQMERRRKALMNTISR